MPKNAEKCRKAAIETKWRGILYIGPETQKSKKDSFVQEKIRRKIWKNVVCHDKRCEKAEMLSLAKKWTTVYTDKKEHKIFLICKEIQMGSGAKSYMRKGFQTYEEMRKYLTIYEDAVSHIWSLLNFLIYEENYIFFFYQCRTLQKMPWLCLHSSAIIQLSQI